jgi:AraC-like DNA-binding protein
MSKEKLENLPPVRLAGEFSDYGELARVGGWNLGFRQLDPGPQSISASIVAGDRVTLMSMKFSRGFHQTGCPPKGSVTFGLPVEGMQNWFGRHFRSHSILPFNYVSGVDGVSVPGFRANTISIDEAFLREISDSHKLPVPDYLLAPRSGSYIPDSGSVRVLREVTRRLLDDHGALFGYEQEASLVIELLKASLKGRGAEDKSSSATRERTISLALNYIEEHPHAAVTVGEICSATGVAWRTLNRAFNERFGIAPKTYLKRKQLSAVRDQIFNRSGGTSIADSANNWGFWHMGQFAQDYRQLFGELPSETLRSRRHVNFR